MRNSMNVILWPGRNWKNTWLLISLTISLPGFSCAAEEREFILARAPQSSALITYQTWQPFVDVLVKETGVNIKLKVYKGREEFESDLLAGKPDLVYLNPYYYLLARARHGYMPLLRSDGKKLQGIIVSNKDAGIDSVRDLQGKVVAFPSPNAFAASLLTRAMLVEKEQLKFDVRYVGTHDNVYRHVLSGKAAAGGGVMRTFLNEKQSLSGKLKIIYKTPSFAPHPLAVSSAVPVAVREKIAYAILKMAGSEQGREMLKEVKLSKPIRANHKRDYSHLEKMKISKYATMR